jgi:hypothetical protein
MKNNLALLGLRKGDHNYDKFRKGKEKYSLKLWRLRSLTVIATNGKDISKH